MNEALRAGLAHARQPQRRRYRLRPTSLGGVRPGFNLDTALRVGGHLVQLNGLPRPPIQRRWGAMVAQLNNLHAIKAALTE